MRRRFSPINHQSSTIDSTNIKKKKGTQKILRPLLWYLMQKVIYFIFCIFELFLHNQSECLVDRLCVYNHCVDSVCKIRYINTVDCIGSVHLLCQDNLSVYAYDLDGSILVFIKNLNEQNICGRIWIQFASSLASIVLAPDPCS